MAKYSWKVAVALLMVSSPLSMALLSVPGGVVEAATTTSAPGTNLYLVTGNALSASRGTSAATDTIPAPTANSIGTPTSDALTYSVHNVNGAYNGGQTAFNLYVDAGANVGDAPEVQVLYDFNGDGTWDRTETYNYFPTDAGPGWEDYTQDKNIASASGQFADFTNGTVEIKVWNAFGSSAVNLRTNASQADGQESELTIPVDPSAPTLASLSSSPSSLPLSVGENTPLHLTLTMSDGAQEALNPSEATFKSNDNSVATVDSSGLITAVSPGTTTTTATYGGQTASTTVSVYSTFDPSTPPTVPGPDGSPWKLMWDDEFNGPAGSPPDPYKWTHEIGNGAGGWGNNEQEYYTDSTQNAYLNGSGQLVIQAKQQSMGGQNYTSARLNSQNTGSWRYGRIDVRAKLPAGGQGIWPAIWMMPTNNTYGGWPGSGEIDMMEAVDNKMQNVYGTLHFGAYMTYGGGWSDYDPYRQGAYTLPDTGYHTYSIAWTPTQIQFMVDGNVYATEDAKNWFSGLGQANAPFDQPFHLIMNMAVGGNWPGAADASTFQVPQQMDIDYVRAYQIPPTYAWDIPGRLNAAQYSAASGVTTGTSDDLQYVDSVTPTQTNNEPFTKDQDVTYSGASSTTYNVKVDTTGTYEVQYRVASAAGGGQASISMDGKPISTVAMPSTGGDQNWQTVTDTNRVTLTAGTHTMTITGTGGPFTLHWVRFIPAGARYVDDFEQTSAKWPMGSYTYGDASMGYGKVDGVYDASGKKVAPAYQGNYDVQLNYHEGAGGVSEWYNHPLQNLTPDSGLKVQVYGQNTGNEFQVNLEANGHELFNFVDPSHPTYTFKDDFTGWKQITLPFSELSKAANQPDPGSPASSTPDLTNVYAMDVLAVTPGSTGTIYLDALRTYDDNNTAEEPTPEPVAPITYQTIPGLINGDSFGPESNIQTQTTNDTPGTGDGQNVGYIYAGSWMGYFVNVPADGDYKVSYRVSNGNTANGDIQMFEDGTKVGTTTIAPTGGWTTWATVTDTVHLTAGEHLIKLTTAQGNWNLHWFKLDYSASNPITTTATLTSSTPAVNGNWYTHPVTVTLSENLPEMVSETQYSINGGPETAYTAPLVFAKDGDYTVNYDSVNKAGVVEQTKSVTFHIDSTAPTITVTAPVNGNAYLDNGSLTLGFNVSDGGSGVNTAATKATLDGNVVSDAQNISLSSLALGNHSFVVQAADNAGNQADQTVAFSVTANQVSIESLIQTMVQQHEISNHGIANSLLAKAKSGNWKSFIKEVKAQSGKHIPTADANLLIRDATWAEAHGGSDKPGKPGKGHKHGR